VGWVDRWASQLLKLSPLEGREAGNGGWVGKSLAGCWPQLHQAVHSHRKRILEGPHDLEVADADGQLQAIRLFRTDTGTGIGVLAPTGLQQGDHPLVGLFGGMFDAVQDALLITLAEPVASPGPVIVYANATLMRETGYAQHELLGRSPRLFQGPGTDLSVTRRFGEKLTRWQNCEMEVLNFTREGQPIWIDLKVAPLADAEGWYTHWVSVQRDVSDRKAAELRLVEQALSDPLTGLLNRRGLLERLEASLARRPHHVGLIYFDIDRFKDVNDRYGHAVGDALLLEITQRMGAVLRRNDTIARLGGDEFVLLIDQMRHESDARQRAERLRSCLAEPWRHGEEEFNLSMSVGIAFSHTGTKLDPGQSGGAGLSAEELLRRADLTMYEVKASGRDGFAVYSIASDRRVQREVNLRQQVEHALRHDGLVLHGQPLVDLTSGAMLGAEALVRLQTPTAEIISPDQFIPLAERSGLIVPIERWVMAQALHTLARWQAAGQPWSLAINISPQHLEQELLAEELLELRQRSGADLRGLTVEITETVLLQAHARAHHNLSLLHGAGVCIALDDFGTGYSSLSWLSQLPIDQVKIDRSIISHLVDVERTSNLVRGFVRVFQDLGLSVVAEGVETEAQRDALLAMGCPMGQGFLFGQPSSLDQAPWEA
jgi:diguanylate cyclase (GGDEF)-like protein/PAS domain S-box-containing protein